MKKFAFILMGGHYSPQEHQACFDTGKQVTYIVTVRDFEEAREAVKRLEAEGVGAVELCGAFGEERTKELIELTGNRIAIGYVTHLESQDGLFAAFFGH